MIIHHAPRDDLSNKITKSWFITFWTGAEVQGDGCGPPPSYFQNQPSSSSHHPTHTHSHWPHLKNKSTNISLSRGRTEDIISYFTLMSSEIHYYDIIEKMGSWTLMSSEV